MTRAIDEFGEQNEEARDKRPLKAASGTALPKGKLFHSFLNLGALQNLAGGLSLKQNQKKSNVATIQSVGPERSLRRHVTLR
jgi:hypothetical protein